MIKLLEIVMIISTFMYSYLILYCKRSSFIYGIISSAIMTYILVASEVYIQSVLNVIYIITYIYSFIVWKKQEDKLKISNISIKGIVLSIIYILAFTVIMGYTFDRIAAYPYLDAFSAACSMTAVFLLSKKIIQSSYVFLMSNIASIMIFCLTKAYSGIITFIIYMVFNIIRIFTWRDLKKKDELNT